MKDKLNIAMCTDKNYLVPTMACMLSIVENNNHDIDFYILNSSLEQKDILNIESRIKGNRDNIKIISIKVEDLQFEKYPTLGRSKEAYFRLLIPYLLPEKTEKCLYLDGDTIVQGDLLDFYNTSFDGNAFVVCEDVGEILLYHKERHGVLGIPREYKYFNSGVLLFNVEYFRENINKDSMLEYITKNPEKIKFLDQDVLNALFYDKVKYIDSNKYDYMEILMNPAISNRNMDEAKIVHFIKKPWRISYNGINAKYWWKYGKKIDLKGYIIFTILNYLFRKITGLLLLIVSIDTLKKIKGLIK